MAEQITITAQSKKERYKELYPQVESVLCGETDLIANMANMTAMLKEVFDFLWVGFYLIKGNELVLGPFQGPLACTRIKYGRGVCGTAWQEETTQIVPDVNLFPGHIACSSSSKSEIVLPFYLNNILAGVLDIDSDQLNTFDHTDKKWLESMVKFLDKKL
jgi:GAF domain-containing protein